MAAAAYNIPDNMFYHYAIKHQSVNELFHSLYDNPTELTKQHFMAVNSHLGKASAAWSIGYYLPA